MFIDCLILENFIISKRLIIFAGLFSKAIAQSGTNLAPWSQPAYKGVALKRAKQLAQYLGCYMPGDWSKTINCFLDAPAANVTQAFYEFFVSDKNTFKKYYFPYSLIMVLFIC